MKLSNVWCKGRLPQSSVAEGRAHGVVGMLAIMGTLLLASPRQAGAGNFTVTTTNDSGPGSLRQAMLDCNSLLDTDVIMFNIAGPVPVVIRPSTALPMLQSRTTIDARTQPGYSGKPVVWLDGSLTVGAYGFWNYNVTCSYIALGVRGFFTGIRLIGVDSSVYGCYCVSNSQDGVLISYPRCYVGGPTEAERNVLSGNGNAGIMIDQPGSYGARIRGNYIGLAPDGSNAMPNLYGVRADYTYDLVIGGSLEGEGNVISGNRGSAYSAGIRINGYAGDGNGFSILGNRIGTDAAGLQAVSNAPVGITVSSAGEGTIGGTGVWERNLISGNDESGIVLNGGGDTAATNYHVIGNWIGVDATGNAPLGNGWGIYASFVRDLVVGGTETGAGNLVSGNRREGINVGSCSDIQIKGNWVGPAATGTNTVGSLGMGINIGRCTNVTIGGATSAERNFVGGNEGEGIYVGNWNADVVIRGNYVGVSPVDETALANRYGIYLVGADDVTIGGTNAGEGNVVSANDFDGIYVTGSRNRIVGNLIGCDPSGTRAMGNVFRGIRLRAATEMPADDNQVTNNTIAWNGFWGVTVDGGTRNAILGNKIFGHAHLAIDLDDDHLVTTNDVGDADTGANERQNFPVLTNAWSGRSHIEGKLSSKPLSSYRLEFFAGAATNAEGGAEGQRYLGWTNVTTSAGGLASFTVYLPAATPVGWYVGATATDTNGNTSELSAALPATLAADSDANGIADYWETAWFGHTIGMAVTNDPDLDGFTTLSEYLADTCPTNKQDSLRIQAITAGLPIGVQFKASAARDYSLDSRPRVTDGAWTNACAWTPGTPGTMVLTEAGAATQKFYRVTCRVP